MIYILANNNQINYKYNNRKKLMANNNMFEKYQCFMSILTKTSDTSHLETSQETILQLTPSDKPDSGTPFFLLGMAVNSCKRRKKEKSL